jgi:hypothetical protein
MYRVVPYTALTRMRANFSPVRETVKIRGQFTGKGRCLAGSRHEQKTVQFMKGAVSLDGCNLTAYK